jgi:hypothetical protein
MQKATAGRIVHVLVDPSMNNGSDVAPALVTREWGAPYEHADGLGERQTINVRVLCDSQNTLWLTSIQLFDERPDAEALATARPHNTTGYEAVAFWPPRA